MKALFDTNILVDYLNGVEVARDELARYEDNAVSIISWMEVMAGAQEAEAVKVRAFLSGFSIVAVNAAIAEAAMTLRRERRLKLPDAIVWASALSLDRLLVTRDEKDFPPNYPGVRVPYKFTLGRWQVLRP